MVIDLIRNRWSPYSFSDAPIEEDKLKSVIEAARYAPSSMNEQPWTFVVSTRDNPGSFGVFLEFLEESNRIWARNAWALVISLARTKHAYKDRPNRYALHDTGMAVANMLIQAASMDICVHQMGGFFPDRVKKYFNLGDDTEPVAVMALGYPGDGNNIPEKLRERDSSRRPRKPLSEIAFRDRPGNPL